MAACLTTQYAYDGNVTQVTASRANCIQQTVLISGDKAVVVNIPHPARYALHKLLVYGEREDSFAAESNKDLMQAGCLLTYLKAHWQWEVNETWSDLKSRGRGWTSRIRRGLEALNKVFPELEVKQWLKLVKAPK